MANWLNFKKLGQWEGAFFKGFQYDYVTDKHIQSALKNSDALNYINMSIDHEHDEWLWQTKKIQENRKHAYRIAALVKELSNGTMQLFDAIELDTFVMDSCRSCVANGHHRIRALQYLGVQEGPFSLNGDLDLLEDLVEIAGVQCDPEFEKFFNQKLLTISANDVAIDFMCVMHYN